jgi:hypothetical protein
VLSAEEARQICALRASGLTMRAMARELGHSQNTIEDYLHGRTIPGIRAAPPDLLTDALAGYCRRRFTDDPHLRPRAVPGELAGLGYRTGTAAAWAIADAANRYINFIQPWQLAKAERNGDAHAADQLDSVLATLVQAIRTLGGNLTPFLPGAAARIAEQCAAPTDDSLNPTRSSRESPFMTSHDQEGVSSRPGPG